MFESIAITLRVKDLEKAAYFYSKTLALPISRQNVLEEFVEFKSAGFALTLRPKRNSEAPLGRQVSIGFRVRDMESTVKHFESLGIRFEQFDEDETSLLAYFRDPDGNSLYFMEVKSKDRRS